MHIVNVFYRYSANTNGMGDTGKLGGKYKTFELTLTRKILVQIEGRSKFNSSKYIQNYNQENSSHGKNDIKRAKSET